MKYLLKDCDEAMVKIKMAFRPDGENNEDARIYVEGIGGAGNVLNFGDVTLIDPLDMGMGGISGPIGGLLEKLGGDSGGAARFAIPFNLEGEGEQDAVAGWIEAEEEDFLEGEDDRMEDSEDIRRAVGKMQTQESVSQDDSALVAVNMTLNSQLSGMGQQEEGWHSFDPDAIGGMGEEEEEERHVFQPDDDDQGLEVNQTKDTDVSDVELVRGGADETSSLIGRPSIIGSDLGSIAPPTDQASITKSQVSDNEFPLQDEEVPSIPFDDESPTNPSLQDSSLMTTTPDTKRSSLAIGGLDVVLDTEEEERRSAVKKSGTKRKRRRRRIEIDNEQTELSSEYIKAMLRNTSDIVKQNRIHPADYVLPEENEEEGDISRLDELDLRPWKKPKGPYHKEVSELPYETLLGRPNLADNGALAPEILALWEKNASRLRGEALPFRMRGESGEEQIAELAEEKMEDDAEKGEDIELARRQEGDESKDDDRLSMDFPEQENIQEEEEFPTQFDDDMPQPMDEEEEEDRLAQEQEGGVPFADDMFAMQSPARSVDSQRSSFSLGAVNDLEKEIAGERQEQGEELATSESKWHKHTVRVLGMLNKNMTTDTGHETLPNSLSYDKLSYGVSRRTACGVFFELLQLKTWDFIELGQEESYSDITITPGVRFNESPPTE